MEEPNQNYRKLHEKLAEIGFGENLRKFSDSTRTSLDAANVLKCKLSQIAKSIVFKGEKTGKAYLIIASGSNRVNEDKIEKITNEKIKKADAEFVKSKTGFSIGGVPPFEHKEKIEIFIDKDLMNHSEIWAAAGNPHSVFKLTPLQLEEISRGKIIEVA